MDINDRVLLLAVLKKKADENLKDVLMMLENARVFTLKEGKRRLKELKNSGYIANGDLTLKGESLAKEIEQEFKL